tara:strand:- start:3049 stop:3390 length:342 start_codon:yes stop_codon:yes gene_type:complete
MGVLMKHAYVTEPNPYDEDSMGFRIVDGPWEELFFVVETVALNEDRTLRYQYRILELPSTYGYDILEPDDTQEVEQMIGDIVVEIISNNYSKIGDRETANENRDNDTAESAKE